MASPSASRSHVHRTECAGARSGHRPGPGTPPLSVGPAAVSSSSRPPSLAASWTNSPGPVVASPYSVGLTNTSLFFPTGAVAAIGGCGCSRWRKSATAKPRENSFGGGVACGFAAAGFRLGRVPRLPAGVRERCLYRAKQQLCPIAVALSRCIGITSVIFLHLLPTSRSFAVEFLRLRPSPAFLFATSRLRASSGLLRSREAAKFRARPKMGVTHSKPPVLQPCAIMVLPAFFRERIEHRPFLPHRSPHLSDLNPGGCYHRKKICKTTWN